MVPLRFLAQRFGIGLAWRPAIGGVLIQHPGAGLLVLDPQRGILTLDGKIQVLGASIIMRQGRTYVPISQLSHILKIKARWNPDTHTVTLEK